VYVFRGNLIRGGVHLPAHRPYRREPGGWTPILLLHSPVVAGGKHATGGASLCPTSCGEVCISRRVESQAGTLAITRSDLEQWAAIFEPPTKEELA